MTEKAPSPEEILKKSELFTTQALRAHQHGKMQQAEALYKQAIKLNPNATAVFHLLGLLELQMGHPERAIACMREAIRQNPKNPAFYASLGMAMRAGHHIPEAKDAFFTALSFNPKNAEVLNALGALLLVEKDYEAAERYLKEALELRKDYLDIYVNLGNLELNREQYDPAEEYFRKALQLNPRAALAHYGLAKTYHAQGVLRKVTSCLETTLVHDTTLLPARFMLAEVYEQMGRLEDAEAQLLKLVEKQHSAQLYVQLGGLYLKKKDENKALAAYKHAIDLENTNLKAFLELGKIFFHQKKLKQAIAALFRCTQINPEEKEPFFYLGRALTQIKKWREAITAYSEAAKGSPNNVEILGELLDAALHCADFERAEAVSKTILALYEDEKFVSEVPLHPQLSLHIPGSFKWQVRVAKDYANTVNEKFSRYRYEHGRSKKEIINLGYISPYFGDKFSGLLLKDVLIHHNRKRFKLFLYNSNRNPAPDAFMGYGLPGEDVFRNLSEHSDKSAAERIYRDNVHILIDLCGPTRTNDSEILFYQPAAIQCLMAGYPSTSGAPYYQYFLTSRSVVTAEENKLFTEKLAYLPETPFAARGFFANDSFMMKEKYKLPTNKTILCNFQKPYHIDFITFTAWCKILQEADNAVLWLQSDEPQFEENIKAAAKKNNVDPERIIFSPPVILTEHAAFTLADIMLESFMVPSRVHCMMALWSGLPVIALAGEKPQSRTTAAFLGAANCQDLIFNSVENYIKAAVDLCHNAEGMRTLRTRLIKSRSTSSLFNPLRYILSLEEVLRDMWSKFNK